MRVNLRGLGDEATTGNSDGSVSVDSSGGTDWASIFTAIANPLTKLAVTRYGVPQLNPGQSITQGPGGTYQYTQNGPGVTATGASLTSAASLTGSLGLILPLLLGVGVLAMVAKGK